MLGTNMVVATFQSEGLEYVGRREVGHIYSILLILLRG